MLTRLEQESMGLRAHILKHDVQYDLNQRRESLEALMDRMRDLSKVCAALAFGGHSLLISGFRRRSKRMRTMRRKRTRKTIY